MICIKKTIDQNKKKHKKLSLRLLLRCDLDDWTRQFRKFTAQMNGLLSVNKWEQQKIPNKIFERHF